MNRPALTLLLALALASGAAIAGCSGTETGNPPFAPDVGYGGFQPMGLAPNPRLDTARVAIDEARVVDCDGVAFPLLRHAVIDFVGNTASVGQVLEIPIGTYCGLEISIASCTDPDNCRSTTPGAFDATGQRSDGARVEMLDVEPMEVTLEAATPFELGPDAGGVLLTLDLNGLTAGLSITTATTSPDGVVRIDASDNADRLTALRSGLSMGLALYRDLDDDGVLDREELLEPALATPPAP